MTTSNQRLTHPPHYHHRPTATATTTTKPMKVIQQHKVTNTSTATAEKMKNHQPEALIPYVVDYRKHSPAQQAHLPEEFLRQVEWTCIDSMEPSTSTVHTLGMCAGLGEPSTSSTTTPEPTTTTLDTLLVNEEFKTMYIEPMLFWTYLVECMIPVHNDNGITVRDVLNAIHKFYSIQLNGKTILSIDGRSQFQGLTRNMDYSYETFPVYHVRFS